MARHLAPTPSTGVPAAHCAADGATARGGACCGAGGVGRCGRPVSIGEVIAAAEAGPGWDAVTAARLTGRVREGLALARLVAGLRERGLYLVVDDVA